MKRLELLQPVDGVIMIHPQEYFRLSENFIARSVINLGEVTIYQGVPWAKGKLVIVTESAE